jgi:hypothetical protein
MASGRLFIASDPRDLRARFSPGQLVRSEAGREGSLAIRWMLAADRDEWPHLHGDTRGIIENESIRDLASVGAGLA